MRALFRFFITGLLLLNIANGAQMVSYPAETPAIDFNLPEGWEIKSEEGALFASPKDDASFFLSLAPMESGEDDPQAAIKEAKGVIEDGFENVQYEEIQKIEGEGVAILLLQAKGDDEDGKANISSLLINRPEAKTLFLMQIVSSQEGFEKHGEDGLKIIRSVKAHAGDPAGETQTYHYPDKENSAFSLEVPADWKLEGDDKGAHIVSADKMFTTSVVVIDAADAEDATESIKKDVGARYDAITWEDAVTNNDAASGMSLTSTDGLAEGKGNNFKVGVLLLSKEDGKKAFILSTWAPEKALANNEEAILKMLMSVKIK